MLLRNDGIELWDLGTWFPPDMSCRVCRGTRNVKHGYAREWALCYECYHNRRYVVIRLSNEQIEYRGVDGIFSGPRS